MVQPVIEKEENLEQNASQSWVFQAEGHFFNFCDHEGFHDIMVEQEKEEHQQKHCKESLLYFFEGDFVLFVVIKDHKESNDDVCGMEIEVILQGNDLVGLQGKKQEAVDRENMNDFGLVAEKREQGIKAIKEIEKEKEKGFAKDEVQHKIHL